VNLCDLVKLVKFLSEFIYALGDNLCAIGCVIIYLCNDECNPCYALLLGSLLISYMNVEYQFQCNFMII
jgi:hypothetical protein